MKKNYILSAIALCACLLSACNKEMDTPQGEASEENKEGVITYIRATGNENASKGSIDGESGSFSWNVGDQIAVWNTVGESAGYNVSAALTSEDFSGDNATFSFTDLGERSNYAVSPAWIRVAGNPTSVTLPGTYTLAQVASEKSPVPMIAVNSNEGTLHFKQLGALLRITLNNLPPSTRSVTIDFNGKKVQGTFAVSNPGTATPSIATEAASDGNDVITINTGDLGGWTDGQDVNIPVPTGTYTTITVKSWDTANGGGNCTLQMTRWIKVISGVSSNWNPIRTSARKVIASLPAFSVSASKRVAIAPANLVVNSGVYSFHSSPWLTTFGQIVGQTGKSGEYPLYVEKTPEDFPEALDPEAAAAEANEASSEARRAAIYGTADRDLFQWGELTDGVSEKKIDFGTIDGHNDWYLATYSEWNYIVNTRPGTWADRHHKIILTESNGFPALTRMNWYNSGWKSQIFKYDAEDNVLTWGGTCGIFIFPDAWDSNLNTPKLRTYTEGSTIYYTYYDQTNKDNANPYLLDADISSEVFLELIAAGAVFLPAAGIIYGGPGYGFSSVGASGGSRTSTIGTTEGAACFFDVNYATWGMQTVYGQTQHRPARLVREIN